MRRVDTVCYTGTTHVSLRCGSLQVAYFILLHRNGKVAALSWQPKKMTRVTKPPLAVRGGADACCLIKTLISGIFLLPNTPEIKCMANNNFLFDKLTTTNVTKDLRLRVDIARLWEMEEKQEI